MHLTYRCCSASAVWPSWLEYAERLRLLSMAGIELRSLGWRFWYGGPWLAASLVTCVKPG